MNRRRILRSAIAMACVVAALLSLPNVRRAFAGVVYAISEYGVRYLPQSTVPANCATTGNTCVWVKSSDNNLYFRNAAGSDVNISNGAASSLQAGYTAGGAGGGAITVTSSGGPLKLTPNADSVSALRLNYNSLTQSAAIMSIFDNGANQLAGFTPTDSGQSARLDLTSQLNGGYDFIHVKSANGVFGLNFQENGGTLVMYGGNGSYEFLDGGASVIEGLIDSTGVSSTVGFNANIATVTGQQSNFSLNATTAAISAGTESNSPGLQWQAQAWNSVSLAAQTVKWLAQVIPGAASNPVTGQLSFYNNDAGGGYNERMRIADNGTVTAFGSLFVGGTGGAGAIAAASFSPGSSSAASYCTTANCTSATIGRTSIATTLTGSVVLATQATTIGSSFTITPSSNTVVKLTYTSATNVTTGTISAGTDGQILKVMLIQPGSGTAATMVTSWTNVSFAGGAGSFTATLGKRDVYTFVYDGTTSKWYEQSRSLNLTN